MERYLIGPMPEPLPGGMRRAGHRPAGRRAARLPRRGVARAIRQRGAAGAVLGSPCTDPAEILDAGLPVWCDGVSPVTTRLDDLGGAVNQPIACGGLPVLPGDVVLADATGVLVMLREEVHEVVEEALRREARGRGRRAESLAGAQLGDLSGASPMVRADQEAADG